MPAAKSQRRVCQMNSNSDFHSTTTNSILKLESRGMERSNSTLTLALWYSLFANSKDLGKKINLFSNFKTSFAADKVNARAGANYTEKGFETSLRLESDFNERLNISERSVVSYKDLVFGASAIFDLKGMGLSKYDFVLGYKPQKKFSAYITQFIIFLIQ